MEQKEMRCVCNGRVVMPLARAQDVVEEERRDDRVRESRRVKAQGSRGGYVDRANEGSQMKCVSVN